MLKAVFFDIGGVVAGSPIIAIHAYEKELGLPEDYLNVQIVARGNSGAWQKFERGEIPNVLDFYNAFGSELSDTKLGNAFYEKHLQKRGQPPDPVRLPARVKVDGRELFGRMMRESAHLDPYILGAIHRIKESRKYLVIALTNNFVEPYNNIARTPASATFSPENELKFLGWSEGAVPKSLRDLFHDFVDSSEVGMRKPELDFYRFACKRNGLQPDEVIFLDDLGINLKAASMLGMRTIHVPIGGTKAAIQQLEKEIGLPLLSSPDKSRL